MKTCLVILAVITIVNAAYNSDYEEYDEEYEDAKFEKLRALKASQTNAEEELKKPIYNLADASKLFEKFIKDYNKQYKDDADYKKHYENFVNTLKEINEVNSSGASFSTDINLYADLGKEEYASFAGGIPDE